MEKGAKCCCVCGCENGRGKEELRPYGPNGAPICAGCCLGNPEREKEARGQVKKIFDFCDEAGVPALLDEDGIRPLIGRSSN